MKIKKIIIIFVSIIIFINLIFVFGYFKYYVYPQVKIETNNIQKQITSNIKELENNFDKYDSINDAIKDYLSKHSSSIYIEDEEGKVVYNNADIWDIKLNYYISKLVNVDGTSYIVKLFEPGNWNSLKSLNIFAFFEIIVVLIVLFLMFIIIKTKLLKPIDKILKSINNYKFGIKPKKVNTNSELDLIQNEFVDLVDSLELEKNNQRMIISSVSHDIKTPITSIIGYSDRLINSKLDKKTKEKYINIIYQKALSLNDISNEFEEYLYQKNSTLKLENIKISELKNMIQLDYKIDLSDNNIDLRINLKNDNDDIYIDINKMKRVFSNIISNSVRYLKKDGIIEINGKKIDNYYQFEIVDNGTGTNEDLNKIFEPLYTTDKSRKISGLGLSICKEIIEMHNGSIFAYNNNYGGLTIKFTIKNNNI